MVAARLVSEGSNALCRCSSGFGICFNPTHYCKLSCPTGDHGTSSLITTVPAAPSHSPFNMQCSQSLHLSLLPGDLDALNNTSAQSLNLPKGTTCVSRTGSANGAAIDIFDVPLKPYPINVKKSKREPGRKIYVHSIPLIVLFCYFCLWIASDRPDGVRSTS